MSKSLKAQNENWVQTISSDTASSWHPGLRLSVTKPSPAPTEEKSQRPRLDEGGIQLVGFMVILGPSFKQLLDEGGLLLLQLGDPLALIGHLLQSKQKAG